MSRFASRRIDARTLTVCSRGYCHLCEEMIAALRALRGHFDFQLEIVDVDEEPGLEQRYGQRVPVLAHRDRELCHYVLDGPAVTASLSKFR